MILYLVFDHSDLREILGFSAFCTVSSMFHPLLLLLQRFMMHQNMNLRGD